MTLIRRLTTWIYDQSIWLGPLWILLILYLSTHPLDNAPDIDVPGFDKLVHMTMYFVLTVFLYSFTQRQKRRALTPGRSWIYAIVLSVGYGGMLELVQEFLTKYRQGDWFDFLANLAGAFLAWLIYKLLVQPLKNPAGALK